MTLLTCVSQPASGSDGIIRIWNRSKRMPEELFHWNEGGRLSILSPDDPDGKVHLERIETLDQLLEFCCDWLKEYLAVHPDAPKVCPD